MQLDPASILRRIALARKKAGLTQQQVADVLKVHKRTVENWEHQHVPWDRLNDLASLYDRPVEWFLYERESPISEGEDTKLDEIIEQVGGLRGEVESLRRQVGELLAARGGGRRGSRASG